MAADGVVILPNAEKGQVYGMGFDLGEKQQEKEDFVQEDIPESLTCLKICLTGDKGVGKTCLQRFAVGLEFRDQKPSKKFNSKKKRLKADSLDIAVDLSDPPSECSFNKLTAHLLDMDGVFLCFDICSAESFQKIQEYQEQIMLALQTNSFPMTLIALKADLSNDRAVSADEAKAFAKKLGISYAEVSAKTDADFDKHLKKMVKEIQNYYMPLKKKSP
eukprot:CAMPEP_0201523996 /NCGR_PEP_ID=MMETSP0161_2-20130828/21047_1 /ASSEMBLY_ACC=CAM_ASM_000251 /TAXON_ID=180227 /ORGANISM="Neoparamoeba aestuarina, Strain SoJaBio B1-5/56/2" /LENGTH=217 /DNA_ID=CAMNT_0047923245 /DNA_START=105 /DNA_END=754 /DNA_ORIENTATION=-